MRVYMARYSDIGQRSFPPVESLSDAQQDPGNDGNLKRHASRRLLDSAHRSFSISHRLLGWQLEPMGKLGRLLQMREQALEAERTGRWQRADYFWQAIQEELRQFNEDDGFWQGLFSSLSYRGEDAPFTDPAELQQRLTAEVFIDTHCALFNGHVQETTTLAWNSRAFAHFDFVKGMLDMVALSEEDLSGLLLTPSQSQAGLCQEAKQWEKGLEICEALLNYLPEHQSFQNLWVSFFLAQTLSQMRKGKSEKVGNRNAATLQRNIQQAHAKQRQFPYNLSILQLLGHLYHQLAINLANSGQLAESIVAAQKALTYYPTLEEAQKSRDSLIVMMQQLQVQFKSVEQQLRTHRNARLNATGIRMRDQAWKGLKPLERYVQSEEAKEGADRYFTAQGRWLWNVLGLPVPAKQRDEQARALMLAVSKVVAESPETSSQVTEAWDQQVAEYPILAEIDRETIIGHLDKRLVSEGFDAVAEGGVDAELRPPPYVPLIMGLAERRLRSTEPFAYWLFDKQNMRLKMLSFVAVVLLILVGSVAIREVIVRQAREGALTQVVAASEGQDDLVLIESAERFFSNKPLNRSEEQEAVVFELYTEAFVRWFISLEGDVNQNEQEHIAFYQETFSVTE